MLRIAWVPRYTPLLHNASTRLRVYYLHRALSRYRDLTSTIGYSAADVLIIQKVCHEKLLRTLERSKHRLVIFDYQDEIQRDKWFRPVIAHCSLVLVDNEERRKQFESFKLGKEVVVLEDCIDYGIAAPMAASPINKRIAWFGNYPNIASVDWQAELLPRLGYEFVAITDASKVKRVLRCSALQWKMETFIPTLRRFGTSILSHRRANRKSANKLITSIAAGVPAIVESSASYEAILRACNLDYAICPDATSLKIALAKLGDHTIRTDYLARSQSYCWSRYNAAAIAGRLRQLILSRVGGT